jgi:hypothetical protein
LPLPPPLQPALVAQVFRAFWTSEMVEEAVQVRADVQVVKVEPPLVQVRAEQREAQFEVVMLLSWVKVATSVPRVVAQLESWLHMVVQSEAPG